MKKGSKHLLKRTLSIILACVMVLSLFPTVAFAARWDGEVAEVPAVDDTAAKLAELPAQPLETTADRTDPQTYYVSISGKGGNDGLTEENPLPGLDAVPWDQLIAGDSVLLKKGDTFPGAIRLVDVHGTQSAPITIGTYGTGDAPVIEARGQGIWLPKTGNDAGGTPGKYVSSGITLYDCSYVTVNGLTIVNVPDTMKTSFTCVDGTDRSGDKMTYSGVGVAATDAGACAGITLTGITVRGDSDLVAVKTDTSTTIGTTGVTTGATATARTYTNAAGTYYVSSKSGSDSNNGTSEETPFYSLHKINELNLQPGAKVYLERGSVFENQYLHLQGGGAEGNPIVIDAYGTGAAPVINTNGNGVWYQNYRKNLDNAGHLVHGYVSSCVLLYDVPYVEVKNIGMTNFGRYGETAGADPDLGSKDGGTVPGETGYAGSGNGAGNKVGCYQWGGKMSRTGVAGVAQNKGTVTHTVLQNLDIENIYGNIVYKHMNNGGIYFTVARPLDEATTGIARFDDVRIEGCYLKRVSRWGIAVAHTGYWQELSPNGQQAIPDARCQQYGATNVYIGHNYLEEVGGDPITAMHAYEPFVEYNVAYNGGREMCGSSTGPRYINGTYFAGNSGDVSAGIWPWKCKSALFEHNECYTMLYSHLGGNNDAQPWDADSGDSTIYQYNYSSGNTGGCIMFCAGDAYNTVFRYNVSYKDGKPWADSNPQNNSTRRGILDPSSCPNGQIYNNTFVVVEGTPVYHYTTGSPVKVENNIFYNLGNEYAPQGGWNAASGPRFVKNIYVGFAQTGDGSYTAKDASPVTLDKTALFADTNFTNAPEAPKTTAKTGARTTTDGVRDWTHDWATEFNMFKLKAGATEAVNAGLPHNYDCLNQDSDFGVPRVANTKDFYGNTLDRLHDIGAFDSGTADPEGVVVSSVGYDRATIQWSAVANAASYKVALDDGEPVAADTESYHTCSSLFPLAEYTVSVTAYDADGQALGAARTATFTTTRPTAPANPDAIQPIAVKAGSEAAGNGEGKDNAVDGSSGTIWHTNWSGSNAADRWIAVDLGSVQAVKNFQYLPRQDGGEGGGNGVITQYEIYISSTDTDWTNPGSAGSWTKAKEGSWANNKEWKTVAFDANTTARYVKLKCVAGVNNHASAAEIAVNGTPCTSVTLADATVAVNKTVRPEVTTTPAGSAANNIVWTSSNRKVATVDSNGVVTGRSVGTTTITAHLLDDTTATCTVTVTPRELSDACALVSSIFEIGNTEIKVPFTEKNPTTVAEVAAGLTVSEAATVKVFSGETEQADTANVAADMTVRIVAENGTSHTDYTVAQKNEYNNYNDWTTVNSKHQQGNVWFAQYKKADGFHDWESNRWNNGGWYSDDANGYASSERVGACDDIRATASKTYQGSGFTFRAPTKGIVTVSFPTQPSFRNANCVNNTYTTYLVVYRNGVEITRKVLPKSTTQNAGMNPFDITLAQGDRLEFMITNEGSTGTAGNGGTQFNPAITYKDEVYKPEATSVSLNETTAALSIGETLQLTAAVLPEGADQTVTWESTYPNVAAVDANGLVTAVGNGTTAIIATATTSWGKEITASCEVTVSTKITGITVRKDGNPVGNTPVKIYANEADAAHSNEVTLTATVEPENASNKTLNWTRPEGARGLISVEREGTGASAVITAVAGGTNVGEVTVEVASAADPTVKTTFKVQVFRYLKNNVIITGDAKVGETLTVNLNQLVMTDAGKAALTFQWKRDGAAINGANEKTYTLTVADYNTTISVDVIPSAATFYEGTRTAAIEGKVAKQAGPAAPEGLTAVKCTSGDDGKITGLDSTKAYEYSANGTDWTAAAENATEITGLAAGTYHVRFAATDTQEAGAAVTKTVLAAEATGYDISFHVVPADGGSIDVNKNPAVEDDQVTITVTAKPGYVLVTDSLSVTYTDEGQQVAVAVTNNTFTMPAADVTVSATFEKQTVKLTHELTNIDCDQVEHDHTVEYGDKPVIHLVAQEGYTMPSSVTIVKTGTDEVFNGYTYSHKAATPDEATITFDQGITEALTIRGAGAEKFYTVNYTVKNGLTAPESGASRTVKHKAAYTGTLVAEHPEQYKLPLGVQITMGGATFTDFTYSSETGVITIEANKITGNLVITAEGLDATVPVHPVTGVTLDRTTASVQIGKTITLVATVRPENATDKNVVWSSSDSEIATVSESGVVTGVAEGTVTITVTTVDGNRTATCSVTVSKAASIGGGGGSSAPSEITQTETRDDGSKVTTVTKPDGTVTETVEQTDGSKSETVTAKDGAVTITVTDKDGEELAKVELPATIPTPETRFDDVPEGHWADKAIHNAAALELVKGVGNNKFDMVAPMSRGSLATVLHRLSQGKTDYESTFRDVAQGKFYTEGVAWAAKAGVVTGYTEDIFAPEDVITREQLAVMLARYAKLIGLDTKADGKALEAFADGENTGSWAVDGMAWCVENGILQGKGGNVLDPTTNVTRAEVAVMLDRFIALIQK